MVINNGYIGNVNKINNLRPDAALRKPQANAGNFESILKETVNQNNGLKFSKHAELRLQARNINLTQSQKDKMNEAVSIAESKGVKDSLVLMDNLAFVVNVRNRTVITAVNGNELKDNVFTNIDGAVIV
jgi:flagellar operon protein